MLASLDGSIALLRLASFGGSASSFDILCTLSRCTSITLQCAVIDYAFGWKHHVFVHD